MPKRVIDFDAMWGSDKLAACAEWAQAEYAWLYGLADASGCFELTNLRVIWGRVAAIRRNLTIERLEQIFGEFQEKGLLFVWEHEGKKYGHWTGSDVPGRLPPPSWRMRLERLAPPVPKHLFAEYVSKFARGRAALPGGGFRVGPDEQLAKKNFESSELKFQGACAAESGGGESDPDLFAQRLPKLAADAELQPPGPQGRSLQRFKGSLEKTQAQDWNWDLDEERKEKGYGPLHRPACGETLQRRTHSTQPIFPGLNSNSQTLRTEIPADSPKPPANGKEQAVAIGAGAAAAAVMPRDKSFLTAKELIVGRGPCCGPVKVKPEALERIRARNASRDGSRSP
jgi:hypothetical protein